MTGARSYTTKIWRQPSSIGFSSADALSTSMDPPGEPVISTRKRPCQKIQNGSEFPELVAQNSRNPHYAMQVFLLYVDRRTSTESGDSTNDACQVTLEISSQS